MGAAVVRPSVRSAWRVRLALAATLASVGDLAGEGLTSVVSSDAVGTSVVAVWILTLSPPVGSSVVIEASTSSLVFLSWLVVFLAFNYKQPRNFQGLRSFKRPRMVHVGIYKPDTQLFELVSQVPKNLCSQPIRLNIIFTL